MKPEILVIDNYDSFTYNLVQYLGELGAAVRVFRNDAIDVGGMAALRPKGIVLSPGPCTPSEAGVCVDAVRHFAGKVPILGVCLGHQAIGQAFGGRVVRNHRVVHGKATSVWHRSQGIFAKIPCPFEAGRYHSLVIERSSLPRELKITAWTDQKEIMGVRHRDVDVEGVQFHPESVLTPKGKDLLSNWLGRLNRSGARR